MHRPQTKIGLILGDQSSKEVQSICQEITRQGYLTIVLDSRYILRDLSIEYFVNSQTLRLIIKGHAIDINQISGVYWSSIEMPTFKSASTAAQAFTSNILTEPSMDCACLLQLLFSYDHINWVNSFRAIQLHRLKPKQLALAQGLGANIPPTYVGNHAPSISQFLAQHPASIIKPVFAGGHTQLVPERIHSVENISKWANYPLTLQAYIGGKDVRTYVIGNFLISAVVNQNADNADTATTKTCIDYREADIVSLTPITMPVTLQQLAIRIMRAFHMQYTAIDWRLTPEGDWIFLEANPAPLFVHAQAQLGAEIDRAIVDLMFA